MSSILLLIDNNLQLKANYRIKFEFCPAFTCIYEPLHSTRGEGGVLPEKFGRGVQSASQNPYPVYHQNLRFSLPYLWPDQKFDNPFTIIVTDTVVLNIIFEGLLFMVLPIMMKK